MSMRRIFNISINLSQNRLSIVKQLFGDQNLSKLIKYQYSSWNLSPFIALPEWLQDNDYLLEGHRPPLPSIAACFWSVFRVHSESGNIWTHVLAALVFIWMGFNWFPKFLTETPDILVFSSFFAFTAICFSMSTIFHTLKCHSEEIGILIAKVDYVGICLHFLGSFLPMAYFGFYCDSRLTILASMIFGVAITLICVFFTIIDKFSESHLRPVRALMFGMLATCGTFPAYHWFNRNSWQFDDLLANFGLQIGTYITGATIYATRIPERFFPGKCDYLFQSHQIFHVMVAIASFFHFLFLYEMAYYQARNNCVIDKLVFLRELS